MTIAPGPQTALLPLDPDRGDMLARDACHLIAKLFRDAGFEPRCAEIFVWHKRRPQPSHYTVIIKEAGT